MTTADLFPTVEEVGAVAIHMFGQDPDRWHAEYPVELAVIVEQLDQHPSDNVRRINS